jgi:hypothetical protein
MYGKIKFLLKAVVVFAVVGIYKITAIGVVLHEFSHQIVVGLTGYRVFDVDYFSHVKHEMPRTVTDALLIGYAPLIINTSLGVIILSGSFGGRLPIKNPQLGGTWELAALQVIGIFVSVSLFFRAVPSLEDIENVVNLMSSQLEWYRVDLMILFLPSIPFFLPTYIGLAVSRKLGTRAVVDFGFTIFALISMFGVIEWWVPIGETIIVLFEIFETKFLEIVQQ